MRYIGQLYGQSKTPAERQMTRVQFSDLVRIRGTSQTPPPPREITIQSAPRGLFVSWSLPDPRDPNSQTITGWRIYKDDEKTLYASVLDAGTRQYFIESTSGTTPPVTNIFVSSINNLGKESQKVQAQGSATSETGAPAMPSSPPGYTTTYSGGGSTGCVEIGTPVIEPAGTRHQLEENSDWIALQFSGHEPVNMHPETMVCVWKKAAELTRGDRISVGFDGNWRTDWTATPFIKKSHKVKRSCPGGRYRAGTALIELHNLKAPQEALQ